jgi:hypothetical protein
LAQVGSFGPTWLLALEPRNMLPLADLPGAEYTLESVAINCMPAFDRVLRHQTLPSPILQSPKSGSSFENHRVEINDRSGDDTGTFALAFGPRGSMLTTIGLPTGDDAAIARIMHVKNRANAEAPTQIAWAFERGIPITWSVWSPGHAPAFGTEDSFKSEGDERVARVELDRGWGAMLSLRVGEPKSTAKSSKDTPKPKSKRPAPMDTDASGAFDALSALPLPAVKVDVDGIPTSESGSEGEVLLRRTTTPNRIELRGANWRLAGLEKIPGPGTRYFVWMKRH